jgi:hypothetical protein
VDCKRDLCIPDDSSLNFNHSKVVVPPLTVRCHHQGISGGGPSLVSTAANDSALDAAAGSDGLAFSFTTLLLLPLAFGSRLRFDFFPMIVDTHAHKRFLFGWNRTITLPLYSNYKVAKTVPPCCYLCNVSRRSQFHLNNRCQFLFTQRTATTSTSNR